MGCVLVKLAVWYLSVSEPFFAMVIFSFPSPPTGALTVPLINWRNSLFCSSSNALMVSQKSLCVDTKAHLVTLPDHDKQLLETCFEIVKQNGVYLII